MWVAHVALYLGLACLGRGGSLHRLNFHSLGRWLHWLCVGRDGNDHPARKNLGRHVGGPAVLPLITLRGRSEGRGLGHL